MFLRLCSRAPRMEMYLEVILLQCRAGRPVRQGPQGLVPQGLCGKSRRLTSPHWGEVGRNAAG